MSDFSFVPFRPFFNAALAKCWRVLFRQGFAYFNNNVDSKRHIITRTAILCIYIYTSMYIYIYIHIYMYVCVVIYICMYMYISSMYVLMVDDIC